MVAPLAERYTGAPVRRVEDARILSGSGTYVDDIRLPGLLYAAFLRSPFAHARIISVDTEAAQLAPGVVAVMTGADVEEYLVTGAYGSAARFPIPHAVHSCLATDKVRLVGDPIAIVIAESRYLAEDAVEMIEVDYEELPAVISAAQALDPASAPIFDELGTNVLNDSGVRTHGDVEGVFARADHVLTARIEQHRHQNVPMETRGCVVSYDEATGRLDVWSGNQGVHIQRDILAARLGIDQERIRVRTADVGGSFGLKIGPSREDVAVALASMCLVAPVKYIEDRSEHLSSSGQARDEAFDVEVAFSDDGDIQGLKVGMVIDTGAYPGIGGLLPNVVESMIPGPYRLSALQFEFKAVVTNKASYIAYRGPWASETFVRERVIDLVARELGMEPLAVRQRNVVGPADQPAHMITGRSLAGITVQDSLARLGELIDLPAFRRRQQQAREQGRYLGVGMASYIEAAPGPRAGDQPVGSEPMRMRLEDDGTVVITTGQMPHGQGHETTLAQVAADQFGVRFEDVRLEFGDSDVVPSSYTGGSRAATMAGGAALTTARALRDRVLHAASALWEADPADLLIRQGEVSVVGVPASAVPLPEVVARLRQAEAARAVESGGSNEEPLDLSVSQVYDGGNGGWSGGTHAAIVEVDAGTGLVRIERYVVTEDCGEVINPAVVDGQVRGGVAQGVGAVLLERSAYDESGNFLAATFMDYLLPTAVDIPRIEIVHLDPVPLDPDVNFRGVGEGGMIVAPPTVCNAVEDALAHLGVRVHEQHLPPVRILEMIGAI